MNTETLVQGNKGYAKTMSVKKYLRLVASVTEIDCLSAWHHFNMRPLVSYAKCICYMRPLASFQYVCSSVAAVNQLRLQPFETSIDTMVCVLPFRWLWPVRPGNVVDDLCMFSMQDTK